MPGAKHHMGNPMPHLSRADDPDSFDIHAILLRNGQCDSILASIAAPPIVLCLC
jgi:hypothetical protein